MLRVTNTDRLVVDKFHLVIDSVRQLPPLKQAMLVMVSVLDVSTITRSQRSHLLVCVYDIVFCIPQLMRSKRLR